MDLRREAECARDLVAEAGKAAKSMQRGVRRRDKGGGLGPVTEADLACERLILEGLRRAFPDDAIVSEETLNGGVPGGARRVWCVDPIDGTREYADGLPEYACMIGLLVDGAPCAGALSLPADGTHFWGWGGGGVFQDGAQVSLPRTTDLSKAVAIHSRSHQGPQLREALRRLAPLRTIPAGSIGYKVGWLLSGRAHIYIHPRGGTMWWDSAGPAALVLAGGGFAGDASGAPLRYEGELDHPKGLLFCGPGLADAAVARLRG